MNYKRNNTYFEKIQNDCAHCAYCVKHYANLEGTFYLVRGCLHCISDKMSLRESKKRILNRIKCEYWQSEKIQIDRRRQCIENYLITTADKLNEIALILKEDNKTKFK